MVDGVHSQLHGAEADRKLVIYADHIPGSIL